MIKSSIDDDLIARRNNYSKWKYEDTVKAIRDYELDSKRIWRLESHECKTCYYLDGRRVSLQAFTKYICANCGEENMHHNSNVPDYCLKCCEKHSVCRRCGANV